MYSVAGLALGYLPVGGVSCPGGVVHVPVVVVEHLSWLLLRRLLGHYSEHVYSA